MPGAQLNRSFMGTSMVDKFAQALWGSLPKEEFPRGRRSVSSTSPARVGGRGPESMARVLFAYRSRADRATGTLSLRNPQPKPQPR